MDEDIQTDNTVKVTITMTLEEYMNLREDISCLFGYVATSVDVNTHTYDFLTRVINRLSIALNIFKDKKND